MAKKTTKSKASPVGGKRGCLCPDGTYNSECCNGDMKAQGIGKTILQGVSSITVNGNERTIVTNNG